MTPERQVPPPDLVAVDDPEPAWISADARVFRASELNELVAVQSGALAHEDQQARRVLADLDPLVGFGDRTLGPGVGQRVTGGKSASPRAASSVARRPASGGE